MIGETSMNERPEIDMDKYRNMFESDTTTDQETSSNKPKDAPTQFCSRTCRQSYREERISGIELPDVNMGTEIISHKTMCVELNLCTYCMVKL